MRGRLAQHVVGRVAPAQAALGDLVQRRLALGGEMAEDPPRLPADLARNVGVVIIISLVGLGGFVTGPGGVAAWLTRRPLVIHEQNAIAGFNNRCLAHLAREVLEAFPGSFGADIAAHAIGNPVRADISAVAPPATRFASRSGAIRLLVLGGSQGATRLNAVVPFALARLADTISIETRHQAGERWLEPRPTHGPTS